MQQNMRKFYTAILIYFLNLNLYAQSPSWQWVQAINGATGLYNGAGKSTALDSGGNIYTTGNFQGTVDFDPGAAAFNLTSQGASDIFVSKYDSSGNFIWTKSIGGATNDQGISIDIDASDNILVNGHFTGTVNFDPSGGSFNLTSIGATDAFVMKLSNSGNLVWVKQFGGVGQGVTSKSIALDDTGNIYSTGSYTGPSDFDPSSNIFNLSGVNDIYVTKLDNSGNFIWAKSFGGNDTADAYSIATDHAGNIYTTGRFRETTDFDPNLGVVNLTSAGGFDIYIVKLDNLGNLIWAKQFGSINDDNGQCITINSDNSVYTTGYFNGTVDFDPNAGNFDLTSSANDIFVSKLDSSGNFLYAKSIGSSGSDIALSIVNDAAGNVYFAGYFSGMTIDFDPNAGTSFITGEGGKDIFVCKLDTAGNFLWAKSAGGINDDFHSCVVVDASNNLYLTGLFASPTTSFGSISFTNPNPATVNMFVAKIDNVLGTQSFVKNEIIAYPNPFSHQCSIIFENQQTNTIVKLIDMLGKEVKTINFTGKELSIERGNLSPGMYLININDEENHHNNTKIIIQ